MGDIIDLASNYSAEISIGLICSTALLLLISIVNGVRISLLKKKNKKLSSILKLSDGVSIEDSLIDAISFKEKFEGEVDRLDREMYSFKSELSKAIQRVGFVRYNAFGDMGSDLSFSVALLDKENDGVVITSIYGREDSNVYAKPIVGGTSDYKLSVEEIQALDRAKKPEASVEAASKEFTRVKRSKNTEIAKETPQN